MTNGSGDREAAIQEGRFWPNFVRMAGTGILLTSVIFGAWVFTRPDAERDGMLGYWRNMTLPSVSPNLAPILKAPLSVQLHVAAALLAMLVGAVIFSLPKGTGFHKTLGWTWVCSMIIVAATSVAMMVDFGSGVNLLHIFTAMTVISLWLALTGIRRGNVRQHSQSMIGLYIGGLIIAGAFAFIPGRLMWQTVFGG